MKFYGHKLGGLIWWFIIGIAWAPIIRASEVKIDKIDCHISLKKISPQDEITFSNHGTILIERNRELVIQGDRSFPMRKIFSGEGKVILPDTTRISPIWWGLDPETLKDQTISIQSAIDGSKNGTIMLPKGRFLVKELFLKNGISIQGEGYLIATGISDGVRDGTVLIASGNGVVIHIEGEPSQYLEQCNIRNLAIISNHERGGVGIKTSYFRHSTIENLYIWGFTTGIDYGKFSWMNILRHVQVFSASHYGLMIHDQGEDSLVEACLFRHCGNAGLYINYSSKCMTFIDCDFSDNPVGINAYAGKSMPLFFNVIGCQFEDCAIEAIRVGSERGGMISPSATIVGSRFRFSEGFLKSHVDSTAISVGAGSFVIVQGCVNFPGYPNFIKSDDKTNKNIKEIGCVNIATEISKEKID